MDEKQRYDAGMKVRRSVFGDAYVDRTIQSRTDFNTEFQEMVTRHAWGDIWTRPGLDRRTRSLLALTTMIALNRGDEFKAHVRGAVANGCTHDDIKEVLLQAFVYCGAPAANIAFHLAQEVFTAMDTEKK
jgi:4-carboxymuconolactone decarboxylase